MKNNKKLNLIFLITAILGLLPFFLYPTTVKGAITVPPDYSQDLEQSLVYNVTEYDSYSAWFDYSWSSIGSAMANPGGQIWVNFTGFYDKNPGDENMLGNPVPFLNITFLKLEGGGLVENATFANVSSSLVAYNMAMNINYFRAGFLIPTDDFDALRALALNNSDPRVSMWDVVGTVVVNETFQVISFEFKADDTSQNVFLTYDKATGVLVYARVENLYGPDFEIYLMGYDFEQDDNQDDDEEDSDIIIPPNYSQDLELNLVYDVLMYDSYSAWFDYSWSSMGTAMANPGGQIWVNFTGFYDKNPGDENMLGNPVPFLDITFLTFEGGSLTENATFANVSSSLTAYMMAMNINYFRPGFLIPTDDFDALQTLASNNADPGISVYDVVGNIQITENSTLILFDFKADDGSQNVTLLYDKSLGVLVAARVENEYGPDIAIYLSGYEIPGERIIPSYHLFIVIGIIGIISLTLIVKKKKSITIK